MESKVRYRRKVSIWENGPYIEVGEMPDEDVAERPQEDVEQRDEGEDIDPYDIIGDDYDPSDFDVRSIDPDDHSVKESEILSEWNEHSALILEKLQKVFGKDKVIDITVWEVLVDGYECADVTIKHTVNSDDMDRFKDAVRDAAAEVSFGCKPGDIEEDPRHGCYGYFELERVEWIEDQASPSGLWRDIGAKERDWMDEMHSLTGLRSAKKALEDIICVMKGRAKRDVHNGSVKNVYTFEGNPGCGKTKFAKFFANCLKSEGIITADVPYHDVHVEEIIGQHVGDTEANVKKIFEDYAHSVILIDEAYAIGEVEHYGKNAINSIIKRISDMHEDTVLIMAGYPGSMTEFLKKNPGLESRVSERVIFDDYSLDELLDILEKNLKDNAGIYYDSEREKIRDVFKDTLRAVSFNSDANCGCSIGNARAIDNLIRKVELYHSQATAKVKAEDAAIRYLSTETAKKVRGAVINETKENGTALGAVKPPYLVSPEELNGNTFEGIIGNEVAKAELIRQAEIMRKFGNSDNDANDSSADVTNGILMTGYPGCGKTAMARAFANEIAKDGSKVAFIAPDINSLITDPTAIGKLFDNIASYDRCVLFLDEVDTVGTERTSLNPSTAQYISLMTLLTKLDGFKKKGGLFVLSATNHPEVLDSAIRRRLGTEVKVELPNAEERVLIMKKYIGSKENSISEADLAKFSSELDGRSGANIETIIKNALKAAGKEPLTPSGLEDAIMDTIMGHKSNSTITPEERKRIAIHEMGHAVVGILLDNSNKDVSVYMEQRTNGALGYTKTGGVEGNLISRSQYLNIIKGLLGGKAAEEVFYGQDGVSSGCGSDLSRASDIAVHMVSQFGMGEVLLVRNRITQEILDEADKILKDCYASVREMLVANKDKIESGTAFLESNDVLSNSKLREICGIE